MDYSEEQTIVRNTSDQFLADNWHPSEPVTAEQVRPLWKELGRLGFLELVRRPNGGPQEFWRSLHRVSPLLESAGFRGACLPLVSGAVCAQALAMEVGDAALLSSLQDYTSITGCLQYGFRQGLLIQTGNGQPLRLVPYGDIADQLIASESAGNGAVTISRVPAAQLALRRAKTVSPVPLCDGTASGPGEPCGTLDALAIDRLEALHVIAQSIAGFGVARRALTLAVDYARSRRQFGRPIGSFQAIQHKLADAWVLQQSLGLLAYDAVSPHIVDMERQKRARMAGEFAYETLPAITRTAQLVHGAIGITSEHEMQYVSRMSLHVIAAIGVTRHLNWLADTLVPN